MRRRRWFKFTALLLAVVFTVNDGLPTRQAAAIVGTREEVSLAERYDALASSTYAVPEKTVSEEAREQVEKAFAILSDAGIIPVQYGTYGITIPLDAIGAETALANGVQTGTMAEQIWPDEDESGNHTSYSGTSGCTLFYYCVIMMALFRTVGRDNAVCI